MIKNIFDCNELLVQFIYILINVLLTYIMVLQGAIS